MNKKPLANYTWIKSPIDSLNDPTWLRLSAATKGFYHDLCLLAGKSDAAGLLCNGHGVYGLADLALILRQDEYTLQQAVNELLAAKLLVMADGGYSIIRFTEEQGPGDNVQRERWVERQRKSRARALGVEEDSEEETEEEGDKEPEEEKDIDLERDKTRIECHGDIPVTPLRPVPSKEAGAGYLKVFNTAKEEFIENVTPPKVREAVDQYGVATVIEAIHAATDNNRLFWGYVEGALRNITEEEQEVDSWEKSVVSEQ